MLNAREKASLDIQSNLIDARQEGRPEGRQEGIEIGEQRGIDIGEQRGKLTGSVQVFEWLLGETVSPDDMLTKKYIEKSALMVIQLQKRLRDRMS